MLFKAFKQLNAILLWCGSHLSMIGRTPSIGIEDAMVHICKIRELIDNSTCVYWAISLLDDLTLTGTICLWNFDVENAVAEIDSPIRILMIM